MPEGSIREMSPCRCLLGILFTLEKHLQLVLPRSVRELGHAVVQGGIKGISFLPPKGILLCFMVLT